MKILSVGGGSGGHVTPVVAVLREVHKTHPRARVRFWCDRHFATEAQSILSEYDKSVRVQKVISGKFRRYKHLSKTQHLTVPSIVFPNVRDLFLILVGVVQSLYRMILWRPDVVFAKGGYVCLPVGIAAWILRIPVVIHDSDSHPGLTNRLLAPFATRILTGMSLDNYDYPASKTSYVGIPISDEFREKTDKERAEIKEALGFDATRPLVVVTGGGQGARVLNDAVMTHLDKLLPRTNVMLIAGSAHYNEVRSLTPDDERFILRDFVTSGLVDILSAADVVVSRAGATSLLELAAVARPTIVVPNKRLVWQVKQVEPYQDTNSVVVLDEDDFDNPKDLSFVNAIETILGDTSLQKKLSRNLSTHARPDAAKDSAEIITNIAMRRG